MAAAAADAALKSLWSAEAVEVAVVQPYLDVLCGPIHMYPSGELPEDELVARFLDPPPQVNIAVDAKTTVVVRPQFVRASRHTARTSFSDFLAGVPAAAARAAELARFKGDMLLLTIVGAGVGALVRLVTAAPSFRQSVVVIRAGADVILSPYAQLLLKLSDNDTEATTALRHALCGLSVAPAYEPGTMHTLDVPSVGTLVRTDGAESNIINFHLDAGGLVSPAVVKALRDYVQLVYRAQGKGANFTVSNA